MVIRSSSARDVEQLLQDLQSGSAVRREAAVARLRVLGSRAVARLEALLRHGREQDRVAALHALDGLDDPRVVDLALSVLADPSHSVRLQAKYKERSVWDQPVIEYREYTRRDRPYSVFNIPQP